MHYRDNLPGGQNSTPIGAQDSMPIDRELTYYAIAHLAQLLPQAAVVDEYALRPVGS
jgi:hypothetical protein